MPKHLGNFDPWSVHMLTNFCKLTLPEGLFHFSCEFWLSNVTFPLASWPSCCSHNKSVGKSCLHFGRTFISLVAWYLQPFCCGRSSPRAHLGNGSVSIKCVLVFCGGRKGWRWEQSTECLNKPAEMPSQMENRFLKSCKNVMSIKKDVKVSISVIVNDVLKHRTYK